MREDFMPATMREGDSSPSQVLSIANLNQLNQTTVVHKAR